MGNEFNGDLTLQIGFLLKRAQQALRTQMDAALANNGLTTSQYAVLAHLRETPGLSNAELARRSFVTAPTMIRIVQDLEKLGHITREDSALHKRVIDMTLTPKGKKALGACDAKVVAIQRHMVAGLNKTEVAQFSRYLIQSAEQLESKE